MQLVAYGAQDVYLTAEPTITFWKAVYRRHTNFAMESMEQTLNGTAQWGNKVVCRVSRNGDLMGRCFLRVQLPVLNNSDNWCNRVGFRMLKSVELRVGGQMIDRHYATWMHIWTELSHTTDQKNLLDVLVGPKANDAYNAQSGLGNSGVGTGGFANTNMTTSGGLNGGWVLNIPLLFAFCRHPGLALPLIALQYHEVEIHIEFENFSACLEGNTAITGNTLSTSIGYTSLWVDYIFLDTEERKEFAQKPHEYLIEIVQNQDTSVSSGANSVRLTFNHPTKFLAWVARSGSSSVQNGGTALTAPRDPFTDFTVTNTTTITDNAAGPIFVDDMENSRYPSLSDGRLQLNGQDRFAVRTCEYFNYVQPYQYFTGCPDLGINVYSFALKPEEHQPSGSCNLSRIDNVNLLVTGANSLSAGTLSVYALSYNVFRVASGMGGLAYSN